MKAGIAKRSKMVVSKRIWGPLVKSRVHEKGFNALRMVFGDSDAREV